MDDTNKRLSGIPQVEKLLSDPGIETFIPLISRPLTVRTAAASLEAERRRALADPAHTPDAAHCKALAIKALERMDRKRQKRVLNGTGIVLHTNLGRSPIDADSWDEAREANIAYSPVEMNLDDGKRGSRGGLVPLLAATLAGAEAALIVNNNAAAVFLALAAIAKGKEVLIARGEQVQIGGGFRIPEILELAGARFVEIGTTNIVDAMEYRHGAGPDCACALLVHTSNFAIRGFTRRPAPAEVVAALPTSVPVIVDQGSGCTGDDIPGETRIKTFLDAGCALVCFSADKLLGGPQAGIIAGRADLVGVIAAHPLYRALRPGKTVYAILERILVARLNGLPGPAARARAREHDELKKFARKIRNKCPKGSAILVESVAASGGGTGPDETFTSAALELSAPVRPEVLLTALRRAPTSLVAIIRDGKVQVDMATLADEDPSLVGATITWAIERCTSLREAAGRASVRRNAVKKDVP
ncbi:MAG: L-seryl-tRNA(Sec) selenium transferase [Spirochaetota bacterium]